MFLRKKYACLTISTIARAISAKTRYRRNMTTVDHAVGAFSQNPPWVVNPEEMTWRIGINEVRNSTRAELPLLLQKGRRPPVKRAFQVVFTILRAFIPWFFGARKKGGETSRSDLSKRLRIAFTHLGPTYIKLGQILSSGEGIFPAEVVDEFKLLRDRVPPETFEDVRNTIEQDLGMPLESIFSEFSSSPLAAASIAQVHVAKLRDGQEVVVKVQRPKISQQVRQDLAVMNWLAPFLVGRIPVSSLANPPALVELFADTILEELDFRLEAQNMLDVAEVLATTDQRSIVVPRPHPELITRRVLVMERLSGFAWDDVAGMKSAGVNTEIVLRAGMISFLEGAMLFGVFHGDLHGGNLLVQTDGTVALLDFGITGRLDPTKRLAFLRLLVGATANQIPEQIAALRDLGALPMDVDIDQVIIDLGLDAPAVDPTLLSADEIIVEIQKLAKGLLSYGAKLPKELMLFAKNMLFMDSAVALFAPNIDILGEIAHIANYFAEHHGDRIAKDVGFDPREVPVDLDGVRATMGLTPDVKSITYKDLQKRREIIRSRLESAQSPKRRKPRR